MRSVTNSILAVLFLLVSTIGLNSYAGTGMESAEKNAELARILRERDLHDRACLAIKRLGWICRDFRFRYNDGQPFVYSNTLTCSLLIGHDKNDQSKEVPENDSLYCAKRTN